MLSGGSGKETLLMVPAPWAEPSATLKILPRSISPPGCEQQHPRHREVWGWLLFPPASCSGRDHPSWRLVYAGSPFSPASMPAACPTHKNSSPKAVGRGKVPAHPACRGVRDPVLHLWVSSPSLPPNQPALRGKTGMLQKRLKNGCECPPSREASAEHMLPFHYPSKHPSSF